MSEVASSKPCEKCGHSLFPNDNFCSKCGESLKKTQIRERIKNLTDFTKDACESAAETATELMRNPKTKKVAGGAVLGAGIGLALPLITVSAGAAIGAAIIGYRLIVDKKT